MGCTPAPEGLEEGGIIIPEAVRGRGNIVAAVPGPQARQAAAATAAVPGPQARQAAAATAAVPGPQERQAAAAAAVVPGPQARARNHGNMVKR
ncbi:hypothetical protein [Arthrobacter sp. G119Y2]|uniref:hypothetical protein n=1 Tax=Arthrobacter sp. G119Y2 TaxID=3134965 RepID=UPI003119B7DC